MKVNFKDNSYKYNLEAYYCWKDMHKRCGSLLPKYKLYKDCSISEEWYNFEIFLEFFKEHYREGFQLDKDLLVKGNKIYSKETCCFVPNIINTSITIKNNDTKDNTPQGVRILKQGTIQARVRIGSDRIHLGSFTSIELAFKAYKDRKEKYLKELANEYKDLILPSAYEALVNYNILITD